jgi:hypothetical protein
MLNRSQQTLDEVVDSRVKQFNYVIIDDTNNGSNFILQSDCCSAVIDVVSESITANNDIKL